MLFPSLLLNGGRDDFYFDKGECVNGNESRRAGHHRPRGKLLSSRSTSFCTSTVSISSGAWACRDREKGVNIISVALDAPGNVISALSGKIGRLDGITAKTVYAPEGSIGKEENQ